MTDDGNLKIGLAMGLVGAVAAFAGGLQANGGGHTMPIHHGLVGCIMIATGLLCKNDVLTPAIALTGVGMAASDIQDVPQWLDIGYPPALVDTTKGY